MIQIRGAGTESLCEVLPIKYLTATGGHWWNATLEKMRATQPCGAEDNHAVNFVAFGAPCFSIVPAKTCMQWEAGAAFTALVTIQGSATMV